MFTPARARVHTGQGGYELSSVKMGKKNWLLSEEHGPGGSKQGEAAKRNEHKAGAAREETRRREGM